MGSEGVRVTLNSIYEVRLDVRTESEIPAVQGAAHICSINAGERLLGIGKGLHSLLLKDIVSRKFLKAGSQTEDNRDHSSRPR